MRAYRLWLIAIVLLAAVLDLWCLGCVPLSQNEAISYAVAKSHGADFVQLAVRDKPENAIYYFVLRAWIAVGTSEFALRLLSVIFAVASIPVLYALTLRLFEQRTAIVAATLLAVSTSFTLQAQNARCYSMAAFVVLVATLILVDNVAKPSRFKSILYILAMAVAVYTHTLSILIVPAHFFWMLTVKPSREVNVRFAKQMIALAIALIPAAWLILRGEPDQFNWIPPLSALTFKDLFTGFVGAPYGPSNGLRRVYMAVYLIAVLFGVVGFARAWSSRDAGGASWVLAASGFIIPTFLLIAISIVHPLYQFRYLVMSLPFFTMFAAAGLCSTDYRFAPSLILFAIVSLSIFLQSSIHRLPTDYPWQALTRTLLDKAHVDDALIITPTFLRFPFDYYIERSTSRGPMPAIAYPRWDSRLRVDGEYVESFRMRGDNPFLRQALEQNYSRLWIVAPSLGTPTSAAELQSLAVRYKCHASEKFAELELIRFDNCENSGAIR